MVSIQNIFDQPVGLVILVLWNTPNGKLVIVHPPIVSVPSISKHCFRLVTSPRKTSSRMQLPLSFPVFILSPIIIKWLRWRHDDQAVFIIPTAINFGLHGMRAKGVALMALEFVSGLNAAAGPLLHVSATRSRLFRSEICPDLGAHHHQAVRVFPRFLKFTGNRTACPSRVYKSENPARNPSTTTL